jgi:integrase
MHCTVKVVRTWSLRTDGTTVLGPPKTEAGVRTLSLPPQFKQSLIHHLDNFVGPEKTAWLFPGEADRPISPRTLDRVWKLAREAIGRTDLRLHDVRHSGLTWAAIAGASTAELMHRGGHSSPQAALRYQHATMDRDRGLAAALGELVEQATVLRLGRTKDGRSSPSASDVASPHAM